jgi:hypothetical protein
MPTWRKNTKLTLSRVGLDICDSEIIRVIEYAIGLGYGSRIWARNVGCAKYPRSVPNFICNFSISHMKYFWLKIRTMVGKKRNNQNRQARDRSGIAIHMMSWGDYICNLL